VVAETFVRRVAPFGAIYFTGLTLLEALVYPRLFTVLRLAVDRPHRPV
jgi:hypothetical protein